MKRPLIHPGSILAQILQGHQEILLHCVKMLKTNNKSGCQDDVTLINTQPKVTSEDSACKLTRLISVSASSKLYGFI